MAKKQFCKHTYTKQRLQKAADKYLKAAEYLEDNEQYTAPDGEQFTKTDYFYCLAMHQACSGALKGLA